MTDIIETGTNEADKIENRIAADLKAAMIAKDAVRVSVLRSLKSAFTYAKVAPGASDDGTLSDDAVLILIAKESKKRQESADSYTTANQPERADDELAEKAIIDAYLPAQLSQDELQQLIDEVVAGLAEVSPKAMGQVMAAVKAKAGPSADGSLIAQLVKAKLAGAGVAQ